MWILHNVEPPTRTPLNLAPLGGVFNWTAWYRQDSDLPVPYGGYTRYADDRYGSNRTINFARHNYRLAAWMSSNCYDYNRRQLLIRRIKVSASGGSALEKIDRSNWCFNEATCALSQ